MKTKNSAMITETEFAALVARGARVHFNRATLELKRVPYGPDNTERRFVMEGPSGVHSLLYDATDLDRLNAHWIVFANDPRNDYPY